MFIVGNELKTLMIAFSKQLYCPSTCFSKVIPGKYDGLMLFDIDELWFKESTDQLLDVKVKLASAKFKSNIKLLVDVAENASSCKTTVLSCTNKLLSKGFSLYTPRFLFFLCMVPLQFLLSHLQITAVSPSSNSQL